jgi:acyl-homoserine lactone acylase PvdQ
MRAAKWVVIPTLIGIAAYFAFQSPKAFAIKGLDADVHITYNDWGIPYINATTNEDAIFALGYAHARDRLWQMDLSRRLAKGELSELVGEIAFETDVFMRTIGIKRNVESLYRTLSAEDKVLLLKYAEGINTYVLQQAVLPLEYLLSWNTWTLWHPTDTIALTKLMGLSLNVGWVGKTIRYKLVKALGEEAAAVLLPHQHERMRKGTYILDEGDLEEGSDDSEDSRDFIAEEASGEEEEEETDDYQALEDVVEETVDQQANDVEDEDDHFRRDQEDIQERATDDAEEAPEEAEEDPEEADEDHEETEEDPEEAEEDPEDEADDFEDEESKTELEHKDFEEEDTENEEETEGDADSVEVVQAVAGQSHLKTGVHTEEHDTEETEEAQDNQPEQHPNPIQVEANDAPTDSHRPHTADYEDQDTLEDESEEIPLSEPDQAETDDDTNADDDADPSELSEEDVDASEALEGVGEVTDKMINKSSWASNNWAVAGKFTRSGKPMMAYDPHLATSISNSWHLADIRVKNTVHIAGAFLPGTYLAGGGRNDFIAW